MEVDKGIRKPNEARRKIDLSDTDGGDDLLINGAYVPLKLLEKIAENNAAAAPAGGAQQSREPPGQGGQQQTGKEGKESEKKAFEF